MSITVRLFDNQDLSNIATGKNKWLTTIFLNKTTFSETEIRIYPYQLRKEYMANIEFDGMIETVTFYATDDKMAFKFINAEYDKRYIKSIERVSHTIRYKTIYTLCHC